MNNHKFHRMNTEEYKQDLNSLGKNLESPDQNNLDVLAKPSWEETKQKFISNQDNNLNEIMSKSEYLDAIKSLHNFNDHVTLESMEKGRVKDAFMAGTLGIASMFPQTTSAKDQNISLAPVVHNVKEDPTKSRHMAAIAEVESSGGKNLNHQPMPENSFHRGSRAVSAWGVMPITIQETVKAHPDLYEAHGQVVNMTPKEVNVYSEKNPDLAQEVASRHYDRLNRIFGPDPVKISYAWFQGVTGTKKALSEGKDISQHWHVQKILRADKQLKQKQSSK